jgi:hypothetical protein
VESEMIRLHRFGLVPLLAMTVALFTVGCPQSQNQVAAGSAQTGAQDQASDPASANLAPADSSAVRTVYAAQQSAPPDAGGSYDQGSDDPGYGAQPVEYADQPPPPLPDYEQPPAPGDDYLWTPGYWAWGQGGYYWVPGGWVEAPYEGALWTPGYWGYHNHRYGFYRGYWGPHIGFYGGVDYGYGYVGVGYQGGYWGGGHFNYNRSVNNVNVSVVHNVYNRGVSGDNRGGARVSFNGGQGGLQARARPAELAARHETHAAPMRAQLQNERAAGANRAQFANVNHGRPASMAVAQPLAADRNVRAPAAVQARNQSEAQQRNGAQTRPNSAQPAQGVTPVHNQANQNQPNRGQMNQNQPNRGQAVQNQPSQNQPNRGQANQNQSNRGQSAPQQQRQAEPQHQAAQQQQQRQAAPQQQQRQAAPQQQQQRQAAPQQQQRQAAPQQQQRQAAPQQQQRQAAPQQQHQAAPQQHQAAPQQHKEEEHPKK